MVYLNLPTVSGLTLYLDIHHTQSLGGSLQISGLFGDGIDEGEIALDVSAQGVGVAWADMLPDSGLPALAQRYGREALQQLLTEAGLTLQQRQLQLNRPLPHSYRSERGEGWVGESPARYS